MKSKTSIVKIIIAYLIASYFYHPVFVVLNSLVTCSFLNSEKYRMAFVWWLFSPITALINLALMTFGYFSPRLGVSLGSFLISWLSVILSLFAAILIIKFCMMKKDPPATAPTATESSEDR